MKRYPLLLSLSLTGLLLYSCGEQNEQNCKIPATVVELPDGCGYGFELTNGKILQPVWDMLYCGTPPLPPEVTEDPMYNFNWVLGKRVLIGFEDRKEYDACGNAKPVKITCIQEADALE